nr:hypothetical protein GCM10020093_043080 [Planobispora longispora]
MVEDRRETATDLTKLVAKITEAQRTAGLYDLVLASENALRQAFERLGVPLPPLDPDSPFAPMAESA